MNFVIADTFTDSLARLTGDEQKAVKTTAFDLQMNPASPGMQFHKLEKAKDRNFWSVRVSADIRLIVHRTAGSLLLCYVEHHDKAYAWAERRKLETHPKTGAAQLVELRETVQQIIIPQYVAATKVVTQKAPLFSSHSDDELLGFGVPQEWIADVRAADEDSILAIADHLPAEAAEALLELATGGTPRRSVAGRGAESPFEHPDAQRRFRTMANVEELARALDFPWDKWTVFLHPDQRQWVERDYSGPARVSGSAGTGKTIVALHRAAHLARQNPESRVLLTTFSIPLEHGLQTRLRRLVGNEPRLADRIDVQCLERVGLRLHKSLLGPAKLVTREQLRATVGAASAEVPENGFSPSFLMAEWNHVVDAWGLGTWEAYRDVTRLGRRSRLPEARRQQLWKIFQAVRLDLNRQGLLTQSHVFHALATVLQTTRNLPYQHVVVDEAQDLSIAQLKFLAAFGANQPNALFFAGDLGQRIFQQPFSWKSAGVDVRGRSRHLRVNYRTSHQIRQQADRLLAPEITDADGVADLRSDTVSVFNGPAPAVRVFETEAEEQAVVTEWIAGLLKEGIAAHEIGVFVRSEAELSRAKDVAAAAGLKFKVLDEQVEATSGFASVGTMHLAKGLEFRGVAVMACDEEVLPLQSRIEQVGDDGDLQETYDSERQLLYVACTRARDRLLVSGREPASEFLADLAKHPHGT
jgi:mRNA-degrading endonuclease RelE of RelBE toxin-antitoxin system